MIRERPAMAVRNDFGKLLHDVQYSGDRIVITKAGKPVAALVGYRLFERIRLMEREFEALTDQLATVYRDVAPEVAQAEAAEALDDARKQ